jgi:hypothetical protein
MTSSPTPATSLHSARRIGLPPQAEGGERGGLAARGERMADSAARQGRQALLDAAMLSAGSALWDESSWHLHRCAQLLLRDPPDARRLDALCALASQTVHLRQCLCQATDVDRALTRRLAELARDLCFEVVRQLASVADLGHHLSMLLAVAEVLDSLGDCDDAQAMRQQALHGLQAPARSRN